MACCLAGAKPLSETNPGISLIGTLGTNCSIILIEIYTFSLKKMHLKMLSGNLQPFCLCLNVLKLFPGRQWCKDPVFLPSDTCNSTVLVVALPVAFLPRLFVVCKSWFSSSSPEEFRSPTGFLPRCLDVPGSGFSSSPPEEFCSSTGVAVRDRMTRGSDFTGDMPRSIRSTHAITCSSNCDDGIWALHTKQSWVGSATLDKMMTIEWFGLEEI